MFLSFICLHIIYVRVQRVFIAHILTVLVMKEESIKRHVRRRKLYVVEIFLNLLAMCPSTLKYLRLPYSVQMFLYFPKQGAGVK